MLDIIGKAWGLGNVLEPFITRYGRGFPRVFPFREFRSIVIGNKHETNLSPAIFTAVFEAPKSAPKVDQFFQDFYTAIETATSPDGILTSFPITITSGTRINRCSSYVSPVH